MRFTIALDPLEGVCCYCQGFLYYSTITKSIHKIVPEIQWTDLVFAAPPTILFKSSAGLTTTMGMFRGQMVAVKVRLDTDSTPLLSHSTIEFDSPTKYVRTRHVNDLGGSLENLSAGDRLWGA